MRKKKECDPKTTEYNTESYPSGIAREGGKKSIFIIAKPHMYPWKKERDEEEDIAENNDLSRNIESFSSKRDSREKIC